MTPFSLAPFSSLAGGLVLTRFASLPLALVAGHRVFGLLQLILRRGEQLPFLLLGVERLHLLLHCVSASAACAGSPCCKACSAASSCAAKFFPRRRLLPLLLHLVELLLHFPRLGELSRSAGLLDLPLQVFPGLGLGRSRVGQLLGQLLHLLGQRFLGTRIQLLLGQLLLELAQLVGGLLPLALFHRLGHLIGRALIEIVELSQLLAQFFRTPQLFLAFGQLAGQIVQLDERLFAIPLRGLGQLLGFLFEFTEQPLGFGQPFLGGKTALLGQLLTQRPADIFSLGLCEAGLLGINAASSRWIAQQPHPPATRQVASNANHRRRGTSIPNREVTSSRPTARAASANGARPAGDAASSADNAKLLDTPLRSSNRESSSTAASSSLRPSTSIQIHAPNTPATKPVNRQPRSQ